MALVLTAALCMALLFAAFKVLGRYDVPTLPAIVVNYSVAFACGMPALWSSGPGPVVPLAMPALLLGALFIGVFQLSALGTQRHGVAATAVASKMSLVITVLAAVIAFGERPRPIAWAGIALAIAAVLASSWTPGGGGGRASWVLPLALFLGTAATDITLNAVQRHLLTPTTEPLFPTLVFGVAGCIGASVLVLNGTLSALLLPRVLIGGTILGIINHASLRAIVGALAHSGHPASSVFPLMNIGVVLFGTALSLLVFRERLRAVQWAGIGCAVIAMLLILQA